MKKIAPNVAALFDAFPGICALIEANTPHFTIVAVTPGFEKAVGKKAENLIGTSLFENFPKNPEDSFATNETISRECIVRSISTGKPQDQGIQRYDIPSTNGFLERYWKTKYIPVRSENGKVDYVLNHIENVTDEVLLQRITNKTEGIEKSHDFFTQSNVAMHIFMGPNLILHHANQKTFELWGKDEGVIGLPLREYLPELNSQGYPEILEEVYRTGVPYVTSEAPVYLPKNGQQRLAYVNFSAQPYFGENSKIPVGVLIMAREVTSEVEARKIDQRNARKLEMAVEIGQLGVFSVDLSKKTVTFSKPILNWFELNEATLPTVQFLSQIHPEDRGTAATFFSDANLEDDCKHDFIFRYITQNNSTITIKSLGQLQFEGEKAVAISGVFQNTSLLIESQNAAAKSEHLLHQLIESAPFPIGLYAGEEMRIEVVNQAILDVWGKGPNAVGKTYFDFLPELHNQNVYQQLREVYKTGKSFVATQQHINLVMDGIPTDFFFNYNFTPIYDLKNEIYGVMNTATDVTDLVLAKQKAQESENRYRLLIEESSVATALYIGEDLKLQYANDIMLSYWGKDNSVIGKPLREAVPELDGQSFFEKFDRVYRTGEEYIGIGEAAWLMKNGTLQKSYFNYTYKALRDQKGEIYGIHHIAIDATKEHLYFEALRESERNFRSMILQAPIPICILEGNSYSFQIVNEKMEEMLGRKSPEILNRPLFDAMPELSENGLQEILKEVFSSGKSFISEEQSFTLPREIGLEHFYITYIYEPIKNTDGSVASVMVVANDVTQQVLSRKKIEEIVTERTKELAEANKSLQNSNAELAQFAYIASHDLQEPLRKISIFGTMLEENLGEMNPKAKMYLERINNSTARMTNLIKDVLGYSQLAKSNDIFKKVNLNRMLKEVINDYELIIEQKNASIAWPELPVIEAIPLQITQLFSNLISNSLKYSLDGIAPEISVSNFVLEKDSNEFESKFDRSITYYKLVFEDNGIGFKQEYAEKIFSIFQRLHGKSEYEGTGIGLAMCRKIVENHGGTIYAEAKEKSGAKFVIVLPEKQPEK